MTVPDSPAVPEGPAGPDPEIGGAHRRVLSWIYGLIVTAAVLASANTQERGWAVAAYVFVTSLVYWAAESYSHLLATRTVRHRPETAAELRATLSEGWVLVTASYLPLLVVVVCTVLGLEVSDTIVIALSVTVVLLFVAGWRASSASGVHGVSLLVSSTIAGSFGVVMILLKFFIH